MHGVKSIKYTKSAKGKMQNEISSCTKHSCKKKKQP